jgi:hypothetical protein
MDDGARTDSSSFDVFQQKTGQNKDATTMILVGDVRCEYLFLSLYGLGLAAVRVIQTIYNDHIQSCSCCYFNTPE